MGHAENFDVLSVYISANPTSRSIPFNEYGLMYYQQN